MSYPYYADTQPPTPPEDILKGALIVIVAVAVIVICLSSAWKYKKESDAK